MTGDSGFKAIVERIGPAAGQLDGMVWDGITLLRITDRAGWKGSRPGSRGDDLMRKASGCKIEDHRCPFSDGARQGLTGVRGLARGFGASAKIFQIAVSYCD